MAYPMDPIELLRYWLRCIRYEEALAARPRAQRGDGMHRHSVNLKSPVSEREYFKISTAVVSTLLDLDGSSATLPLEGEIADFFEAWLSKRYRFEGSDTDGPEMMVLFPTAHLRRGILAGAIRFDVSVQFLNGDNSRFEVPSKSARRQGRLPPAPVSVRIQRIIPEEGPPFFLDPRLLTLELGVLPEELEQLFGTWHRLASEDHPPAAYLATLPSLFGAEQTEPPAPDSLCGQLFEAAAKRMGAVSAGARCYNVGLTADTGRSRATAYLQKEMEALIRGDIDFRDSPALQAYLSGKPLPSAAMPLQGLLAEHAVTPSQKEAAERFLGSSLTAVQGPPGTGKTTLILHLAAHRLVTRIAAYVETGVMPFSITAVVSTNNRAVDNAMERARLGEQNNLSLTLRTGSRRVCETILAAEIGAAIEILKAGLTNKSDHLSELKKAKKQFSTAYKKLTRILAPAQERAAILLKRQQIETDIRLLEGTIGSVSLADMPNNVAVNAALELLLRLVTDLNVLSRKCERRPSKKTVTQVVQHHETQTARILHKTEKALARVGMHSIELFIAPKTASDDPETALSQWEDAAESGIDKTAATREMLEKLCQLTKAAATLRDLKADLADLRIPEPPKAAPRSIDTLRASVFAHAQAVRNAHAFAHADEYLSALKTVRERIENTLSLRRLKPELRRKLQTLFPIWGCTLLSLGNIFDDTPDSIDEIIIDEAGQCHPAYAVSALLRCRRALVLGDIHQLTPIYTLSEPEERPLFRGPNRGKKGVEASHSIPATASRQTQLLRVFDKSASSVQMLAENADTSPLRLTDHFRCQKPIIEISNRLCQYGLTVHTPHRSRVDPVSFLIHPVLFLPTFGEAERDGGSRFNAADVQCICDLVEKMRRDGLSADEIAIITPYRAQLLHLRRALVSRGVPLSRSVESAETSESDLSGSSDTEGISVGTVHRFQGGERSVVLFSTVITNPHHLGFLNDRVNLINVAVSRAMDHLIVVGNEEVLKKGHLTRLLLEDAALLHLNGQESLGPDSAF